MGNADWAPVRRLTAAAIAAAVGAVLVGLSVPRALAALSALPANPVAAEIRDGVELDDRFLDLAMDSLEASLAWVDDGRLRAHLGLIQSMRAERNDNDVAWLTRSRTTHRRALSLSPSQTYAWTRLLRAELLIDGTSDRLAPQFAMAVKTAPFDRRLTFSRLALGLAIWPRLGGEALDSLMQQVRLAAAVKPARLAALARQHIAMPVVRRALVGHPALLMIVENEFRRL